ncbi:MAG TPA: monovalent cation/H(+) antiporter subunit G [Acidimicrobiales bacterium]|jgi:monovalent cation/proton antiporter MnhG/PhaG subunit|nr:monovalent cation/H(+) antiporter subunit G [Acidimicrobiales bacterium]
MADVLVAVLLVIAVASGVVSVAGVAIMPNALTRLHYLTPVSAVGAASVAVALLIRDSFDQRGIKGLIVLILLAGLNPVVAHAVARSAHTRQTPPGRRP